MCFYVGIHNILRVICSCYQSSKHENMSVAGIALLLLFYIFISLVLQEMFIPSNSCNHGSRNIVVVAVGYLTETGVEYQLKHF